MADERDYALLSDSAYKKAPENTIDPEVSGWKKVESVPDHIFTGFSAGVYEKGSEIVIAFAGTDEVTDYLFANLPARF